MLRFWRLGAKSFRWEESLLQELMVGGDWRSLLDSLWHAGYGWNPLNPFFCWLSGTLGSGEAILRLPAAIFGTLSIYLIYRLGKKVFSEKTGTIAAALFAFSPMAVAWSQDARYFSLALCLSILSAYFLLDALDREHAWIGFIFTHGVFVLTTYQGLGILLAEGVFLAALLPGLRGEDGQDRLKPFIQFIISMVGLFVLLSPWFYYEINNNFRAAQVNIDFMASGGGYESFLDWGGGNPAGFLFCLSFLLAGFWTTIKGIKTGEAKYGEGKIPHSDNSHPPSTSHKSISGFILILLLAGTPVVMGLTGYFRRDQVFFALPYFLLAVAEGINRTAAIFHGRTGKRQLIFPGILGGYFLLQFVPFYNLHTNKTLSFIPKPDWKKAVASFFPQFQKAQTIILDNRRDKKIFSDYFLQAFMPMIENKPREVEKKYNYPIAMYPEDGVLKIFSRDYNRDGFFIQTTRRGEISALLDDPLFRPYFAPLASFGGLTITRYRLPVIAKNNTHSLYNEKFNAMDITRSQPFHKPVLFLEAGDYLVAFKIVKDIAVSVSLDGGEPRQISRGSDGVVSFPVKVKPGEHRFVFRSMEADAARLKWFGVYRLRSERVVFEGEDYHDKSPDPFRWIRKSRFMGRKTIGFYVTGTVDYYFALSRGGNYRLTMEGFNDRPAPVKIEVELDRRIMGTLSFDQDNNRWSRLQMSFPIPAGLHRISLSFINDLKISPSGDRNAHIDRFELNRIPDPDYSGWRRSPLKKSDLCG